MRRRLVGGELCLFPPTGTANRMADKMNFEVVVAFDYYDGPESGLAISSSGEGIRFNSVGDSKSRFLRGFELEAIAGDWWPPVRELIRHEGGIASRRVFAPGPSLILEDLCNSVARAEGLEYFVAVGTPDFTRLSVVAATGTEITRLRELAQSGSGFRFVNDLVRGRNR